ncbi:hypothetical protein Slala03_29540 [Streptomyces lavendulae subsp. lavendulae]|uniref:DUF4232 domain-containing protein n=1 Tax=Streptomyces lavendulae TaxID=1914 RepID=UPI00249FB0F2|nr:DUF4232 domain-containing protein [Streptomyces lavendulae]GLV83265.1 hypothetical protein Slala03_29540 [Streptomyces lavendulae subsp. lavendulae]
MKGTRRRGAAEAPLASLATSLLAAGLLAGAGTAAAATEAPTGVRAPAAACTSGQLTADSAQRTGSNGVRVTVTNKGPKPCTLKAFPTVGLAGQGSPGSNKGLSVVRQGQARTVQLPVGGTATTTLTFTPVLGEADGYCASGGTPTVAPTIVVGVAGGGIQLAPDDGGDFALCGNSVRATAFR